MNKFTYSEFFTLGPTDYFTCKLLIREAERATQGVFNQVLGEAAGKVVVALSDEVAQFGIVVEYWSFVERSGGVDRDVIGTEEDDLGDVAVLLDVQDGLGLDDSRVVEMDSLDFLVSVVAQGVGDLFVADGDGDVRINVG